MTETNSDAPAFADMVNSGLELTIPVAYRMGVRAVEVRPGYASSTVPIEGNGNHFGAMYAGVLFTVAEVLGGAIQLASFDMSKYYPLVKDLQIFFRRPAKSDVRAEAHLSQEEIDRIIADADANGKGEFTLHAKVIDADGTVVAETTGLYQLRTHGR
ncbi:YiiD C-terminal domain-containing protein [Nocardia pseudobrasiliensis]|uniref:Thioesterase domain-containing protein n=1 Tax=Nocardia pseudobrasiliensis TaxID=45979 RepID=A0A370HSI9_9NOCA|nr:YiiD C-terminal domain-containing protein [Nocardia pseudobrasiliensis]RDI61285.1 thioesterase domain-containing protein [Nocardia pseudobrasiliensis]